MSSEHQHQNHDHAGSCIGHCRAQRSALNYYCTEQYEKDKAAIKSYEDGWDRWDGPIWPWRHTNRTEAQAKLEDTWEGCCTTPPEQDDILATSFPTQSETTRTRPAPPSPVSNPKKSLWHSNSLICSKCGGAASPCNL